MVDSSYTPIPGSEQLRTRKFGQREDIDRLEHLEPGVRFAERVGDALLARCTVRSAYVPVLLDVFDRLAPRQSAVEQALYLQLWRLALADERNFCRVSRRDLQARVQLSERRLGKALAGLAAKRHIVLVDRDRRGTLYQVRLPHEILGEPNGDEILMKHAPPATPPAHAPGAPQSALPVARAAPSAVQPTAPAADGDQAAAPQAAPVAPVPSAPLNAPASPTNVAEPPPTETVGSVVAAFFKEVNKRSDKPAPQVVIEAVFELRESGHSLLAIRAALLRFAKEAPQHTPIGELPRFL